VNIDRYNYDYIYVDLDGNPVKRTRWDYPYSYDPYVVWKQGYNKDNSHEELSE
jgi:hypothetical protein